MKAGLSPFELIVSSAADNCPSAPIKNDCSAPCVSSFVALLGNTKHILAPFGIPSRKRHALEDALVRRVQGDPRGIHATWVLAKHRERVRVRVEEVGYNSRRVPAGKDCEVDHNVGTDVLGGV